MMIIHGNAISIISTSIKVVPVIKVNSKAVKIQWKIKSKKHWEHCHKANIHNKKFTSAKR